MIQASDRFLQGFPKGGTTWSNPSLPGVNDLRGMGRGGNERGRIAQSRAVWRDVG